jgi:hypothetical protein
VAPSCDALSPCAQWQSLASELHASACAILFESADFDGEVDEATSSQPAASPAYFVLLPDSDNGTDRVTCALFRGSTHIGTACLLCAALSALLYRYATRENVRYNDADRSRVVLPESLTAEIKRLINALPSSDANPLRLYSPFHAQIASFFVATDK